MKLFGKLVNFEFRRFLPIYIMLLAAVFLLQAAGVLYYAFMVKSEITESVMKLGIPKEQFLQDNGYVSIGNILSSFLFTLPIVLAAVTIFIYVLFIWYRDWLGKNTFIYRLLMLPVKRIQLFFSKLAAILIFVFGLIAYQVAVLPALQLILKLIIPVDYRLDLTIQGMIRSFYYLKFLLPEKFIDFVINYGFGTAFVIILFTMILIERSYRFKGVFMAVFYGIGALILVFSPYILQIIVKGYFYETELLWMQFAIAIILSAVSVFFSNHLLNRKIRV
ncbi:hypothetical protein [Oceanobacillus oncorhynchi]|uniref:hypothetical protein n=1 Tax=Oceanobacillus oncorhynchi TaxID=545501 RepID=UPI00186653F4|nr:hypothetical protein [Oceanobacillus oncorhynchi]MDM8100242.1 hypothetical protein [Oceanobacillus oncorhynchi]UUI40942.1 hypothetical protein NP440_04965 [Oceanobacillus oncorhynchi]